MSTLREKLISCLKGEPGLVVAVLFGSQVTGNIRDDSDVDVAILFQYQQIPPPLDLIELREKIADKLDKSVDLVCLNTCSPIIGMQILQHGEVLLTKDKSVYNKYLMKLFSEYNDLKFMRRSAENAILDRKYYD